MKITQFFQVGFLSICFITLCSTAPLSADDENTPRLEARRPLPNQHPFYNIFVYEEVDHKNGLILRKQEWTELKTGEKWQAKDGLWYFHYQHIPGQKTISSRPLHSKKLQIESRMDSTKKEEVVTPRRAVGKDTIPPLLSGSEVTELTEKKDIRPKQLIESRPPVLQSVHWANAVKGEPLPEKLLPLLETLRSSLIQWQKDLRGRFGLCPIAKAEAKANGTLETLYVPYPIITGRVHLIKIQLDLLIYQVVHGEKAEAWAQSLLMIVRRLDAIDGQLKLTSPDANYAASIAEKNIEMKDLSGDWNPFSDEVSKTWVLRWQVIAESLQAIIERQDFIQENLPDSLVKRNRHNLTRMIEIREALGTEPWKKNHRDQEKLARKLYQAASEFSRSYEGLAELAESSAKDYLKLLKVLGANEDVRVMAYTIAEALSAED